MTTPTYAELRRLLAAFTSKALREGLRANESAEHDAYVEAGMRALPALLAEAEAGRRFRNAYHCGYCRENEEKPCFMCIAAAKAGAP